VFTLWIIKTEHKRDEDGGTAALELETDDKRLDVNVRWDGCIEIHVYSVTDENRELNDTFHTCDLNGFINALQTLNHVCQDHFGAGSYWEQQTEQGDKRWN
jgi:hypothetical protein